MKYRSQAELQTESVFIVRLSPHRWIPCNHYELAVMYGAKRIVCDYGVAVLDISKLRIDLGTSDGFKTLQDHLQKKVEDAVKGLLSSMTFNLRVTEKDERHVRFILESLSGTVRELVLPRYFETSPATFDRAFGAPSELSPPTALPLQFEASDALVA